MKKVICTIVAAAFVCGIFGGCTNKKASDNISEQKHVELSMYLIGDQPRDYPEMLDTLNTKLKKDINATLEVRWIGWGEYGQKYPLLVSSGEPFDLIVAGGWTDYIGQAKKGAYMDLEPLLAKYAPKTNQNQSKDSLKEAMINDKLYMLPMNFREINPFGYVVRGDLRKKYNVGEIKTFSDFMQYLDTVAKNEKDIMPYNAGSFDLGLLISAYTAELQDYTEVAKYLYANNSNGVESILDMPQYKEFLNKTRQGYLNGYWSKSVLVNKTSSRDYIQNEKSAASILNLYNFNELYLKVNEKHPEWDLEWFVMNPDKPKNISKFTNNGMAISANSKNPERALMLLDLFKNDESYFNLTTYGIEGKNYVIDANGKIALPEGVTADNNGFPPDGACPWGWREEKFYKGYSKAWPQYDSTISSLRQSAQVGRFSNFNLNEENIKTELASFNNIDQQYGLPLVWGIVETDKGIDVLKDKLNSAGMDKVKSEVAKQVNEFLTK